MFNKIAFIFLFTIKFINCGKFDYDFKQLKLHDENYDRIQAIENQRNDRQLLLNQFLPPIPPFSVFLGNTKPENKPVPLFNFPIPNFQLGNQKPQETNFNEFFQPQTQQDVNKDERPKPSNSGNKKRKPEQSPKPVHLNHNFDEFIHLTVPPQPENNKPTIKPNQNEVKEEKVTKKPNHLDQKINESIKPTIPTKITLKINNTQSIPSDNIFFPAENDETTSLSPIEILSTTPALYSTTHKRIIPGLPSPEDDGDYNEDDKISNSALLSLVG